MEVAWTSDMSVNDEKIDSQHKKLLNELDNLRMELSSGVDVRPLRRTMDFFDKYVHEHLVYEEIYMKEHNFPGFDEHKKIHDSYRKNFKNFKKKFHAAYSSSEFSSKDIKAMLTEAEVFLADWWTNHILKEDHKYAVYIKSHSK